MSCQLTLVLPQSKQAFVTRTPASTDVLSQPLPLIIWFGIILFYWSRSYSYFITYRHADIRTYKYSHACTLFEMVYFANDLLSFFLFFFFSSYGFFYLLLHLLIYLFFCIMFFYLFFFFFFFHLFSTPSSFSSSSSSFHTSFTTSLSCFSFFYIYIPSTSSS